MSGPVGEVSPAEIVQYILTTYGEADFAPGGIIVGPATDVQQQAGVVSLTQAGLPVVERYVPSLLWMRCQVRCLAPTLDLADRLGRAVQRVLDTLPNRVLGYQASTDEWYLLHLSQTTAGPSHHYDSPETWESLLFAELMLSATPVPAPAA